MRLSRIHWLLVLACAGAALTTSPGAAQNPTGPMRVRVFGGGEYNRTDGNRYKEADQDGAFESTQLGILMSAPLAERASFSALVHWRAAEGMREQDIRYAFTSIRLSQGFDVRLGKVKHPGALYSEVFDVGTLRPFLSLPDVIYGAAGNAYESYTGAGIKGTVEHGPIMYKLDAYLGGGAYRYRSSRAALLSGADSVDGVVEARDMVGGRIALSPIALPALTVGLAGATSHTDRCPTLAPLGACPASMRMTQASLQLEYVSDRVWLRSEGSLVRGNREYHNHAWYAEAAYFVTPAVQLAAEYGWYHDHPAAMPGVPDGVAEALDRHREVALGANYWFSPGIALKVSLTSARGNRFAVPEADEISAALQRGVLRAPTRVLQAGMQFSY